MNKGEFVSSVCEKLRASGARKPVAQTKTLFHISDDKGNESDFVVKTPEREVIYTVKDVALVVDACLDVVYEALKRGEDVSIHGYGKIGVHRRAPRSAVHPGTGEAIAVAETYVPKLDFGNILRRAARIYAGNLTDGMPEMEAGEES